MLARTFKRGYLPNCTEELFTMVRCIETNPPVYVVKDDHGEILEGTFYAEELQKFNEWHRPTQTVAIHKELFCDCTIKL
jgi:hypothetical protein